MATAKRKTPLTTRDNLSALIGSARKILRKDKGLNGDLDRLPMLSAGKPDLVALRAQFAASA